MGACPTCSEQVDPRWNVCPWCGHDLEAVPATERVEAESVAFHNVANRGLLRQPWVWILVAAGSIGFTAIGLAQKDAGPTEAAVQVPTTSPRAAAVAQPPDEPSGGTEATSDSAEPIEATAQTTTILPTTTSSSTTTTTTATTTIKTTVAARPSTPDDQDADGCHDSYTGKCVPPDVEDVDCLGGSGNGPFYIGRVTVVGRDEYGLDRDKDGVGCE